MGISPFYVPPVVKPYNIIELTYEKPLAPMDGPIIIGREIVICKSGNMFLSKTGTWTQNLNDAWITNDQGHVARIIIILNHIMSDKFFVMSRASKNDAWIDSV